MAEWKKELLDRAADSTFAEDLNCRLPRIEIIGDHRVIVENHRGIVGYDKNVMQIACGRLTLRIEGEGLELRTLSQQELSVSGTIHTVEYIGTQGVRT